MARWGVSRGLITLCCAEAKVVRKPLAQPDELQQNSGVGVFFCVQTCPKAPVFPGSGGRSNHKGNSPPSLHLFLFSQTLGSRSLYPGRPEASICLKTSRHFLPSFPQHLQLQQEPGLPGSWSPLLPHTPVNPAASELRDWGSVLCQYFHPNARSRFPATLQGIDRTREPNSSRVYPGCPFALQSAEPGLT